MVFGLDLGGLVGGVVEDEAVAIAKDVVADPAQDAQVAMGEHRGEHGLEQGLAGLAVLASMRDAALAGERLEGGKRCADRRREVNVRHAHVEGRVGVKQARGQPRHRSRHTRLELHKIAPGQFRRRRRLGRGEVHHDHPPCSGAAPESRKVFLNAPDELKRRQASG